MSDVLLGIGMVLVIEGLVYALAPSLVERFLEALRAMPIEARRSFGLGAIALGLIFLWVAQRMV